MFTGIVETVGIITHLNKTKDCILMRITPNNHFNDLNIGDSISINGVCLTITKIDLPSFDVTLVPETLRLTNLSNIELGNNVNLERALPVNGRMGGHYVQGHVDFIGEILSIEPDGNDAIIVRISILEHFEKYIVNKGFITLDGMSITVIESTPNWISVTFIPHTQQASIVNEYKIGSKINIEVDILSKYVEKLTRVNIK